MDSWVFGQTVFAHDDCLVKEISTSLVNVIKKELAK